MEERKVLPFSLLVYRKHRGQSNKLKNSHKKLSSQIQKVAYFPPQLSSAFIKSMEF